MTQPVPVSFLSNIIQDAHKRSTELIAGLDASQLMGPKLRTVNPLRWEIGHVAWFYEKFILRDLYGYAPYNADFDNIYDSIEIPHEVRWDLPLLPMDEILEYTQCILDRCLSRLGQGTASEIDSYIYQFATFHEDMHTEAYTYSRQTLAYPKPIFSKSEEFLNADLIPNDSYVPGGYFELGATKNEGFVFDNEKWAHPVLLEPFNICKTTVTNRDYREFVIDGGYLAREFWSNEGWDWRQTEQAECPIYWQRSGEGDWIVRHFDAIEDLHLNQPIIHVNWYEANAYCSWAKRRLPSEAEWEAAALGEPSPDGSLLAKSKRKFPWGDASCDASLANLDGYALSPIDVGALPESDSAFGCRQMLGNVWEWTASTFEPFGGFSPDAYKDYSQPVFYETKVLRGGAWATRSRMITGRYRNFYTPERRDVLAGFRTCSL